MIKDLIKSGIDEESKPYWDGLKDHKLLIQQCEDCQQSIFYPRSICPHCFSGQLSWFQANGTGSIYSFTIVHQGYGPFKGEPPYVVGIVELDEGVRMMTRIIGDKDEISIGKRVSVVYKEVEEDFVLPYFQLIA
ncbi:Zn-ribbon domain-containing OB-fold protein [Ureibacillus sp. FSL E2-3493]|uniref:Zn-ribbon domain-containing OB-fold protein n=1 Tax=Ureibacillus sp. FSL E2-3493 TaxID=2921367 RepID=UPI00311A3ABD